MILYLKALDLIVAYLFILWERNHFNSYSILRKLSPDWLPLKTEGSNSRWLQPLTNYLINVDINIFFIFISVFISVGGY